VDFKVIFKDTFIEDLERILRRIAMDNPMAARKLGELIIMMSESLAFFPERYPRVRQRPQIRRFIARKYFKIFYRIQPEQRIVEILRCWDGRREGDPVI
jgi:toxin ParE1/3/4